MIGGTGFAVLWPRHNYVTAKLATKGWLKLANGASLTVAKTGNTSDTLTLTESFDRTLAHNKIITDTITLTESNTRNVIYSRTITDTLTLTETFFGKGVIVAEEENEDILNLVEKYNFSIDRNIVDSLVLTETFDYSKAKIRNLEDLLVLSEIFAHQKISNRAINDQLILTESFGKNMIYNRTTQDILNFSSGITKYIGNIAINIAEFEGLLVSKRTYVVFQAKDNMIVLPSPKFGDSESNLNTQVIKRSMGNVLYVYVRKNELQKLSYSFEIGTEKKNQLEIFVEDNIARLFDLFNWKGEKWKVNFSNNPIDFPTKSRYLNEGEKYEVTLEFQGVRII